MNQIKEDQKKKKKVNRSVWVHSTLLIARAMLVPLDTNFKAAWRHLQNSIFTNSVTFFFFPERLFQPAVSTLTIPVLNPLQGRIHLLDNPTRSDLSQAPLHAIVLHQVKSLLQSSIEEPTDTSSPAIDCTPCKTHSKHFLMDHRPRQDRVYPCFAPYSHDVAQSPAFGTIPSLG